MMSQEWVDADAAINDDNKEQLQVEETGDYCRVDFSEIVPLPRDTDGSYTTEYVSRDWFGEVREVHSVDFKQEPHDVSCFLCHIFISLVTAYVNMLVIDEVLTKKTSYICQENYLKFCSKFKPLFYKALLPVFKFPAKLANNQEH